MFLQQIQCMEVQTTLDSAQQQSRLDTLESEKMIETMLAKIDEPESKAMLARIYKIIYHIDNLYEQIKDKTNETQIDVKQAIKCADEQLRELYQTEAVVAVLNKLSTNNKLKHIIHKNGITVETTLDTEVLNDLLVLKTILKEHQTWKHIIINIKITLKAAKKILDNLRLICEIEKADKIKPRKDKQRSNIGEKHSQFAEEYQKFSMEYNCLNSCHRKLSEIAVQLEKKQLQMQFDYNNYNQIIKQLHAAKVKLYTAINNLSKNVRYTLSTQQHVQGSTPLDNKQEQLVDNKQEQLDKLTMEINEIAICYFNEHDFAAYFINRYEKYSIEELILNTPAEKLPYLLDPTIEGKIHECLKHVMDPTMYSVDEPHTNDDNSRLLTIGGIAILGVVTMAAGCYLFSNDDSNTIDNRKIRSNDNNNNTTKSGKIRSNDDKTTTSNRTIQLSRKTNTSMQLAKPTNVSATKTTDVSAQPNALAQTHQEQTSANKQIK
jgi:hypothetical protein